MTNSTKITTPGNDKSPPNDPQALGINPFGGLVGMRGALGRGRPPALKPVITKEADAPDGTSASIYPGETQISTSASIYPIDIFADDPHGSEKAEASTGDLRQYIDAENEFGAPQRRRRKFINSNPGDSDTPPPGVKDRSDAEILNQSETLKRVFLQAKQRATADLKPIMNQMLNQPIQSSKVPGQTIDQATILSQDKIAVGLMRRFSKEQNVAMGVDEFPYIRFANWLLTFSMRVNEKVYRKYKNYVVDYLNGFPGEDVSQAINLILHNGVVEPEEDEDLDDDEKQDDSPVLGGAIRRTQIIKEFPINDLIEVIKYLRGESRSERSGDLANLIEASLMTGLRPIEWKAATAVITADRTAPYGRRVWIFVANAKATNGRGNGLVRTIDVSEYKDEGIKPILQTINLAKSLMAQDRFESDFREKFIRMMYRVTKILFKDDASKGYSLYSCRHQASANWKTTMTAIEVAALSGHAIPRTTRRWYGQKKSAWPRAYLKAVARPNPDEVKMVAERIAMVRRYEDLHSPGSEAGAEPENYLSFFRK